MKDRIQQTEEQIKKYFQESMDVMIEKNKQRGDCWRNAGLIAQFVEIHSMYFRLRNLIWNKFGNAQAFDPEWNEQVINALQDMRNFTILAELCVEERNMGGDVYTANMEDLNNG